LCRGSHLGVEFPRMLGVGNSQCFSLLGFAPVRYLRGSPLGNSVNTASSRSHGREGVASHGPRPIGPGLGGFPGINLLGNPVNRGDVLLASLSLLVE
jgi:hypothetical protein